jgi:hypothetical protein
MAAVITRNPLVEDNPAPIEPPHKDDGSGYRFEMIYEGRGSRAYADTAAELLDCLIPGYETMSADERLTARVAYGTGLLAPLQAEVLQDVDQTALSEDERAVLLAPRYEPIAVAEWASEAPLVLLDVHYAPHSDVPAPHSTLEDVANPRNLVWVRVVDEYEMLLSLANIGFIALGENNEFTV